MEERPRHALAAHASAPLPTANSRQASPGRERRQPTNPPQYLRAASQFAARHLHAPSAGRPPLRWPAPPPLPLQAAAQARLPAPGRHAEPHPPPAAPPRRRPPPLCSATGQAQGWSGRGMPPARLAHKCQMPAQPLLKALVVPMTAREWPTAATQQSPRQHCPPATLPGQKGTFAHPPSSWR